MKKLLASLLFVPAIVFARPVGDCEDQAGLAYYAAQARDSGIPLEVYKDRIKALIESNREIGIPVSDIPKLQEIAEKVFNSSWNEEQAYINILAQCSVE